MTTRITPFDQATGMSEEPAAQVIESDETGSSVREAIRERRAARMLQHSDRRTVVLVVSVVMLLIIGLGAMLSAGSVVSIRATETGDHLFYFKRQLIAAGIGVFSLVVFSRIPYGIYRRFALPIFLVAVAGLVVTLVPGIGDVRNGSRRWIDLGPFTIQTSEFAKLATVILLATALTKKEQLLRSLPHFIIPVAAILVTVSSLLLLQPDFGTTVLIGATAFVILFASAAPIGYLAGLAAVGGVFSFVGVLTMEYRKDRIAGFLDPFADPLGKGHQAVQSLVALGTGGWFGVGLGASRARWSFLPNAHTDFIFAIIGEETGFAGASLIIILFALFAAVGVRIALTAPDTFGRLLAVGIVAWLTIQALINIGGVVALLPITGVPLPFVSSGANAMVVSLAAIGILVNISRSRSSEPVGR